ncbi:hypothetical protein FACS1894187_01550 [Synergistales bacterium]|nr:hypothetical protein FACS1894187_01550 [Synergistales bacterium]
MNPLIAAYMKNRAGAPEEANRGISSAACPSDISSAHLDEREYHMLRELIQRKEICKEEKSQEDSRAAVTLDEVIRRVKSDLENPGGVL